MADTPKLILTGENKDSLLTAGPKLNQLIDLANGHSERLADEAKQIDRIKTNNVTLNALKTNTRQCMIAFIDDDGKLETYTKSKPYFESKGLNFTFAVTPPLIGTTGYMTWEQVLEMQSNGHEVGSHAMTHVQITTLPSGQWESELRDSKKQLEEKGCNVNHMIWVGGGNDKATRDIARKYYDSAISTDGVYDQYPYNMYRFPRPHLDYTDPTSITNLTAAVDNAYDKKIVLLFMMHSWFDVWDNQANWDALSTLIAHIQSKGIPIVTLDEVMKTQGNLIDAGDTSSQEDYTYFKIDREGKTYSKNISELEQFVGNYRAPINQGFTIDFGSIPANGSVDRTVAFTGYTFNRNTENALVNSTFVLPAGVTLTAWVNADGTITIRATNVTTSPITLGSTQQFKVVVFRG